MKKLYTILGLMMLLTISMVSAVVIDDFSKPDGDITTSSTNNLGTNYFEAIGGSLSGCSYLSGEAYCSNVTTNDIWYSNIMPVVSVEDVISFDAKCVAEWCKIYFYTGAVASPNDPSHVVIGIVINDDDMGLVYGIGNSETIFYGVNSSHTYHFEITFIDNTNFNLTIDDVYIDTWATKNVSNLIAYSFSAINGGRDFDIPCYFYFDNLEITGSNTAPVINSITPDTRVELTQGDSQLYTADVTDDDGDASYSWTLGSTEVSTGTTYTANWEDIEPGIYTLTLEVSDAEYSDTASTTLEIRAVGGSSSLSIITPEVVEEEQEYEVTADQATPQTSAFSKFTGNVGSFFSSIGSWFGGLFR